MSEENKSLRKKADLVVGGRESSLTGFINLKMNKYASNFEKQENKRYKTYINMS